MKKAIASIIVATIFLSLCSCGNNSEEERLDFLQMKINVQEATYYFTDSNLAIIDCLSAIQIADEEKMIAHSTEALDLLIAVKTRVDASISFPNFISKGLGELEESYEKINVLLSRFSELSDDEMQEVFNLVATTTPEHILLLKSLTALTFLYEIREFDQLPDDEAQSSLKDNWWKFGFSPDVECPEYIDKQELYLLWAKQFLKETDRDQFLEALQVLRSNDDLTSPECNQKWTEFIENFI